MDGALRRPDHEFQSVRGDGDDPRDGYTAVQNHNRLSTANGLEVLAQMCFEIGGAHGSHGLMIVLYGHIGKCADGARTLAGPTVRLADGPRNAVVVPQAPRDRPRR